MGKKGTATILASMLILAAPLLLGFGPARADQPFCPPHVDPSTLVVIGTPTAEPRAEARKACPKGYAVVTVQTCRTLDVEKQTSAIVLRWVIRCLDFGGRP
jgi:hypothetical protein